MSPTPPRRPYVGWSTGLHQNHRPEVHKTKLTDETRSKIDPNNILLTLFLPLIFSWIFQIMHEPRWKEEEAVAVSSPALAAAKSTGWYQWLNTVWCKKWGLSGLSRGLHSTEWQSCFSCSWKFVIAKLPFVHVFQNKQSPRDLQEFCRKMQRSWDLYRVKESRNYVFFFFSSRA